MKITPDKLRGGKPLPETFPPNRPGIDFVVPLDDFNRLDINAILASTSSIDYRGIDAYLSHLRTAKITQIPDALYLVMYLTEMMLEPDDETQPFQYAWRWSNGRRSPVPSDMLPEQFDVLAEFAPSVNNPGLRARLADLSWYVKGRTDMAETAIAAYCESVQQVRDGKAFFFITNESALDVSARELMTRAAQISLATGWKLKASKKFTTLLKDLLKTAYQERDGYGFWFMARVALDYKIVPADELAARADDLAGDSDKHPDLRINLLQFVKCARQDTEKLQAYA